ncbi:protein WAVE-DAMPENED 2-like [Bidens hawaiensis]|uniref:protein WAVE-DAMPENED 2-like n=1 Tax=Bidens hawaiensis TaxID=980011 RepID=UPI004049BDF3
MQMNNRPRITVSRKEISDPPLNLVMGYGIDDEEKTSPAARSRLPGVTVGVAPSFRSAERAEKRKEFYMKLELKNQALEAEKMEQQTRAMEEEEAAIKELRKNMVVKAHTVPSFYYEDPPPKFEPKKIHPVKTSLLDSLNLEQR